MSQTETELAMRIKSYIRETGPIPVSEYMSLCLLDATHGFYPTRDPLGSEADFITAPGPRYYDGRYFALCPARP